MEPDEKHDDIVKDYEIVNANLEEKAEYLEKKNIELENRIEYLESELKDKEEIVLKIKNLVCNYD